MTNGITSPGSGYEGIALTVSMVPKAARKAKGIEDFMVANFIPSEGIARV